MLVLKIQDMEKNRTRILSSYICPGRGGGRGETWYQLCPYVCVEKRRILVPFRLQVNEMNEKMGVKFAVQLYMGRIFEIFCMMLDMKVLRLTYK